MPRYFVVARDKVGTEQYDLTDIYCRVESGFKETVLPADLGLRTIEFYDLQSNQGYLAGGTFAVPTGSMYEILGTPDRPSAMAGNSMGRGGLGSGVLITWRRTAGTSAASGTAVSGTKSLFGHFMGRV